MSKDTKRKKTVISKESLQVILALAGHSKKFYPDLPRLIMIKLMENRA